MGNSTVSLACRSKVKRQILSIALIYNFYISGICKNFNKHPQEFRKNNKVYS